MSDHEPTSVRSHCGRCHRYSDNLSERLRPYERKNKPEIFQLCPSCTSLYDSQDGRLCTDRCEKLNLTDGWYGPVNQPPRTDNSWRGFCCYLQRAQPQSPASDSVCAPDRGLCQYPDIHYNENIESSDIDLLTWRPDTGDGSSSRSCSPKLPLNRLIETFRKQVRV